MKENYFIKDKLKRIALANFLRKRLSGAGFIDVEVVKSVFNTRIVIYSLKPGFVIGKKGSNIRLLTDEIEKKFDLSKVHIEIGEIPNRNLDPKVIMENIKNNISRGVAWKSVVYGALRQIKEAGASGAEIIVKGNTSGKGQRKRKFRFSFGYMKKAGDQKDLVGIKKETTFPGLGTIGVTLRIVKPDVIFSDKIDVAEISKNYKLKIQEEELEERQKEIEKDVTEKKEDLDKKETLKKRKVDQLEEKKEKPKEKVKEEKPKEKVKEEKPKKKAKEEKPKEKVKEEKPKEKAKEEKPKEKAKEEKPKEKVKEENPKEKVKEENPKEEVKEEKPKEEAKDEK